MSYNNYFIITFRPFYRTEQIIISRPGNNQTVPHRYPPPSVDTINFTSLFQKDFLQQVGFSEYNNNNNKNKTFIRSYATQAHGHKPYIQIHNTVINWKNPTYMYMSKQTEKTLHVQTEILRKKLIIHLNRFDYSQLHFCVQNVFSG